IRSIRIALLITGGYAPVNEERMLAAENSTTPMPPGIAERTPISTEELSTNPTAINGTETVKKCNMYHRRIISKIIAATEIAATRIKLFSLKAVKEEIICSHHNAILSRKETGRGSRGAAFCNILRTDTGESSIPAINRHNNTSNTRICPWPVAPSRCTKNNPNTRKIRTENRSNNLSINIKGKDFEIGMSKSCFKRSGLLSSILPGIKLAAATPPKMDLKENKKDICSPEALEVRNCQRYARREMLKRVKKRIIITEENVSEDRLFEMATRSREFKKKIKIIKPSRNNKCFNLNFFSSSFIRPMNKSDLYNFCYVGSITKKRFLINYFYKNNFEGIDYEKKASSFSTNSHNPTRTAAA